MKLVLAEPRLLKDSISVISELVNDVSIKLDKDNIEIIAMDPANVAMVLFKILSSAFVEYKVEKPGAISVSLEQLNQVLKRVKPSDTLTLEMDNEKNRLRVQIKGESTRTFNLSLIETEEGEQKVPDLKLPVKVEVPTNVFNEAIEDMDVVAESVIFQAETNKFTIASEGRMNNAKVEITSDEGSKVKLDKDSKVMAKYSIEYLKKIMKGGKLTDNMVINFNKDHPLKVDYKVMDKLLLSFILAPRVDND